MSQEIITKQEIATEISIKKEPRLSEKTHVPVQTLIESLKSVADDIGQISELTSEERLLVAEFFKALLKLMKPLATTIAVTPSTLPAETGLIIQAYVDPTGHLALMYEDGRLDLKDLSEDANRDLMMAVIEDIVPKFRSLTSTQKRKVENRIKFLSSITKEIQKSAETLYAAMATDTK